MYQETVTLYGLKFSCNREKDLLELRYDFDGGPCRIGGFIKDEVRQMIEVMQRWIDTDSVDPERKAVS